MSRFARRSYVTVLALLLAAGAAGAGEADVTPRIGRVALFKNGFAYVTSRATLPEGAATVVLGQLPVPSYGTFWIAYPKGVQVKGLFARLAEVRREVPLVETVDLLEANVGRTVSLGRAGDQELCGTLVRMLAQEPEAPQSEYVMGARGDARRHEQDQNKLAVIETTDGTVVLHAGHLTQVSFPGGEPKLTGTRVSHEPVVRVELERPAGGETLSLSYLARGLSWAPSYQIDLSDAHTARLSATAEILNEVVDLEDVAVELVTGFPKLDFANVPSPIALDQSLAEFLRALQSIGLQVPREGRSVTVQAMAETITVASSYGLPTEGWAAEDLFLYPVASLGLHRGEVALVPLFTASVPYEHVYTWRVPDLLDRDDRYRQPGEEDTSRQVWHACRLVNSSGVPLTTAPAQFVKDGRIVGQSLSRYCNEGATVDIPINRALGIVTDHTELETSRETRAFRSTSGATYDRVGVKGELSLESSLSRAVKVEVTKQIRGEVVETSDTPQTTRTARGLRGVNPTYEIEWAFPLGPGEVKHLHYHYTVLVR